MAPRPRGETNVSPDATESDVEVDPVSETPGWTPPAGDPNWVNPTQPPAAPPPQPGPPLPPGQPGQFGPPPAPPLGWQSPTGWGPPPGTPIYGEPWSIRAEVKPGIVALRPLSVGEILDGGFATIRKHARAIFGIAAVLGAAVELSRVVVGVAFRNLSGALTGSPYTTTRDASNQLTFHLDGAGLTATAVQYLVSAVLAALLVGVVTAVVAEAILGRPVEPAVIVRRIVARWWKLLLLSLLAGILPFIPFVLFVLAALPGAGPGLGVLLGIFIGIPASVFLWTKTTMAIPAFVLERLGVGASIARGWRLARGSFWRVWWLRALATILVGIAAALIEIPFRILAEVFGGSLTLGSNASSQPIAAGIVITIGSAIVWMLTEPLFASILTLIYVDRRMRAEGLDLELIRAAQQAPST